MRGAGDGWREDHRRDRRYRCGLRPLHALIVLPVFASALCASAAQLDTTPDTLIDRVNRLRDARELRWDPDTGQLGNLRHVQIVAPECTVRVISGAENRLIPGGAAVDVKAASTVLNPGAPGKPAPRDVVLTVRGPAGAKAAGLCFTLQVATAHQFLLGGDRLAVLFDRTALPVVRISLNPSYDMRLWFEDVRIGQLTVHSNAGVRAAGTGQATWLTLDSSQRSTALLFHEFDARNVGVSTTTTDARFSIRIGAQTRAGYSQPARAPGRIAKRYPIWIDGPVSALEVPVGSVDAMLVTDAIRAEAREVRKEVLGRAGPLSPPPMAGPVPDPLQAFGGDKETKGPKERVAEVLQRYAPADVQIGEVNLWKAGAGLEGRAPDEKTAREFVRMLKASGEVQNPQLAFARPDAGQVRWRVLVQFMCEAPGQPNRCLPGTGDAYTQQQIEDALRPILGLDERRATITIKEGSVLIQGRAPGAESRAAMQRVSERATWLAASSSSMGADEYWARFTMVCVVPPKPDGICAPR